MDSASSSIKSSASPSIPKADTGGFDISLANPSVASNTNTSSHLPHQYHFHLHHHQKFLHDGCHQDLGSIRPIRGIPVYYNPPSFSFLQNQLNQQHLCDSSSTASSIPYAVQGMPRSPRFLPRFPAKRGMRAPRMRWTTTLHARFVHAFLDSVSEVELRLDIGALDIQSSSDIFVDVDETSLLIRVKASGSLINLLETNRLFDKIKPSETVWYIDEDQLVVNLKKYDTELKWPDIKESWDSLTSGILQLVKGTSIYIIGDSTEINQEVAKELAMGIGYTPLYTSELLERYAKKSIDSWVVSEGADSITEAEGAVLDGLSSHVRAVVATLGGLHGAARRPDKWRHLYAGFTVWLSKSEAPDEASAKEEARRHIQDGSLAYTNAEVVVKLGGLDLKHSRDVAQGCLTALKQLILSDKQLTGNMKLLEKTFMLSPALW
ncbi:putative inactive shikimate kinase like 2, chloroplastic [Cocos nucifera]|uniref:Putative inactive shikimate kinase like 2, chloroplastic n=1 Tax=Cocos nucifera TaxID=13894 RepID=A0A8K0IEQ7_COCNU|nr:putative inactive shikimate kinase like 2, chloroplastic [Cocos nucifera]